MSSITRIFHTDARKGAQSVIQVHLQFTHERKVRSDI